MSWGCNGQALTLVKQNETGRALFEMRQEEYKDCVAITPQDKGPSNITKSNRSQCYVKKQRLASLT